MKKVFTPTILGLIFTSLAWGLSQDGDMQQICPSRESSLHREDDRFSRRDTFDKERRMISRDRSEGDRRYLNRDFEEQDRFDQETQWRMDEARRRLQERSASRSISISRDEPRSRQRQDVRRESSFHREESRQDSRLEAPAAAAARRESTWRNDERRVNRQRSEEQDSNRGQMRSSQDSYRGESIRMMEDRRVVQHRDGRRESRDEEWSNLKSDSQFRRYERLGQSEGIRREDSTRDDKRHVQERESDSRQEFLRTDASEPMTNTDRRLSSRRADERRVVQQRDDRRESREEERNDIESDLQVRGNEGLRQSEDIRRNDNTREDARRIRKQESNSRRELRRTVRASERASERAGDDMRDLSRTNDNSRQEGRRMDDGSAEQEREMPVERISRQLYDQSTKTANSPFYLTLFEKRDVGLAVCQAVTLAATFTAMTKSRKSVC